MPSSGGITTGRGSVLGLGSVPAAPECRHWWVTVATVELARVDAFRDLRQDRNVTHSRPIS
jgi:hypothetical protein